MKSTIVNQKSLTVILVVVLVGIGTQGINYGQAAEEYPVTSRIVLLEDGVSILFVPPRGRGTVYTAKNRSTVSLDLVRNSKWQRRDDSTSPWIDVSDSERTTGLYGYVITLPGEYRWVGELNINGVWGKYSSRNMLRRTPEGTVTSIPSEVEGVPNDQHKLTLKAHNSGVLSVALSPDGRTLASGTYNGTTRVWDAKTGKRLHTLREHTEGVTSLSLSPDGRTLASGSWDRTVRVWDAKTGDHKLTFEGHKDGVRSVMFSPDGRTLASGSYDNTIQLWDVNTGDHKLTLEGHTHYVRSAVFSPDGNTLASGSYDRTVRVWDAKTGDHKLTLEGHTEGVLAVAFSPDGRTLASGGYDGTIRVWDAKTGDHKLTLEANDDVNSVVFSPDGSTFVSGGSNYSIRIYEDTLRVWDAKTGEPLQTLRGHTSGVTSVAFSMDGSMLASGSWDQTVQVWEMVPTTSASEPAQLVGDINADGVVNIQDLVIVASEFGQTGTGQNAADVNKDGVVNIQDLVLVAGAFSVTISAPAAHPQVVETLTAGEVQRWLLDAKQFEYKDATIVRGIEVLKDLLALLTPTETALLHNYPNPFNPETWIPYQLKTPAAVRMTIYNLHGTLVRELSLGYQAAGRYTSRTRAAYWDGRNTVGEPVASGLYFYTLTAGDFSATGRMVILK